MGDNACYALLAEPDDYEPLSEQELRKQLEHSRASVKAEALKTAILMLMNGEKIPSLLMTVIRYVMPCDDHLVKKLLLIFWEVMPKYTPDGKLRQEMILVCDAYRKDLVHPNEFVRGSTLRFLCKLKEPELLQPLMPSIQDCLDNRHAYVRRNAVLAIYTIYKSFPDLIPDAPELVSNFLKNESDSSCKRNAFMMLIHVDQDRALDYLSTCIDEVQNFNDILQLVIVELVQKVCRQDASKRSRFIRCIYNLLDSNSAAVRYDAAGALLTLTSAPTAITAVAKCYTGLIMSESDNNVKLIVLAKLERLNENPSNERVMQDLCMDILKVLGAPDLTVRKKTIALAMQLISARNVHEVVMYLQKELAKTSSQEGFEKNAEYRQLLVRTLHQLAVKYPDAAAAIVPQLMEFLSDTTASTAASAYDVIVFVREAFERLPALRSDMLNTLIATVGQITVGKVLRAALWIIGEYATTEADLDTSLEEIKRCLGALPIVDTELAAAAELEEAENEDSGPKMITRTRITADGTYATESVYTTQESKREEKPEVRKLLLAGDFFVGAALSAALTKLALKFNATDASKVKKNTFSATAMMMMASILHLGKSQIAEKPCSPDCNERIMSCIHVLAHPTPALESLFLSQCHDAFVTMLKTLKSTTDDIASSSSKKSKVVANVEDAITFRALCTDEEDQFAGEDADAMLSMATGSNAEEEKGSKLSKVFQLSGFSDPVYVEAYVVVHQYDILLDVLIVNQTSDTLQNLSLELATLGDLKLTEKPQAHTLAPNEFRNIKANVKVSSTETGIIFGNIVYDVSGATSDRNCVILNDIHIDIMDYITPAHCNETEFRNMWLEFEWENKVAVRTSLTDLTQYLEQIQKTTNMACLTPESALKGDCNFLAANLYARSVFGEDALANLSIEKGADGQIVGHIRIRAKTQGIALSLGDKITLHQQNKGK